MDSVKTKIEELQKDIDEKWDSLRSAGYELAQLSARMTEGPVTLISPTLRRAFTDAQNDFVFLKSQNLEREELVRRLDEGKRKVSFLQKERAHCMKKIDELAVMLGAVAFAQAGSPDCDEEVRQALEDEVGHCEQLAMKAGGNSLLSSLGRLRYSLYLRKQETVFAACFAKLRDRNLLSRLSGERAVSLLESYKSLSASLEIIEHDLEARKSKVSDSQSELDGNDDLKQRLENARIQLNEAGVNYGLYLFDNGHKWIGPDTPEAFLDLVQQMLQLQQGISDDEEEIEKEKEYSAIADFESMIEFNNKKINDLREEIRSISAEIEKIEEDNRNIRRKIENVEARLR